MSKGIRKTTKQFKIDATMKHHSLYIYDDVKYINCYTVVDIICKKHGIFKQVPKVHLKGSGCPKCCNEKLSKQKTKKFSKNKFINLSKKIHKDVYNYSLVKDLEYGRKSKVEIVCKVHGIFNQQICVHLDGGGCVECDYVKKRKPIELFKKESNIIHNNRYNYSMVNYKNSKTLVKIGCSIHGLFKQRPHNHIIQKAGCPKCFGSVRKTDDVFEKESNIIHNNRYDYSMVNYQNAHTKVKIGCSLHSIFEQEPSVHLKGHGCPKCNLSKGEEKIINYLKNNNIEYEIQKSFKELKYKYKLRFDFYLPEYNTCVEYDGMQHFKIVEYFGGRSSFMKIKHRDKLKNNYCKNNNITLIKNSLYGF